LSGDRRRTCHRRPGPSDHAARFVYHGRLRVGADPVVGLPGATGEAADSGRGHVTTATTVGCNSAGRPGCVDAEFRYLEPQVWQFPLRAQPRTPTARSRKHSPVFGGRRTIIRSTFCVVYSNLLNLKVITSAAKFGPLRILEDRTYANFSKA